MKPYLTGLATIAFAAITSAVPAAAQMSSMMNSAASAAQGSGMSMPGMGGTGGGMGGMSLPSLGSASPNNIAGLLQYCVKNNYLGGASAASASDVQGQLLSKADGSATDPTSNAGFSSGSNGVVDTGNGQTATLGGSGMQAEVTQKVCGEVLSHAKSLL